MQQAVDQKMRRPPHLAVAAFCFHFSCPVKAAVEVAFLQKYMLVCAILHGRRFIEVLTSRKLLCLDRSASSEQAWVAFVAGTD